MTMQGHINDQSRSQSMPVRGLVVGMALAKPNAICNFIGCRKISETYINGNARFERELCVGSWIMRNDVNKIKGLKETTHGYKKNETKRMISRAKCNTMFLFFLTANSQILRNVHSC